MARSNAVTAVTGVIFKEGWSKVKGSSQGMGHGRKQLVRAAMGSRAAVFKAIRSGGCSSKMALSGQLEYLTTKSSHIVDSRGVLSGKTQLSAGEISGVVDRFARRWDQGFNPTMGHTTHLLMSFPIGTRGADVRDIAAAVCEKNFANEDRNFDYLIAVHEDRAHPHAHVVLNRRSQEGEFFYLGRDHHFNYDDLRFDMVEEAEKVGVRLEATRRIERGVLTYSPRRKEVYDAKAEGREPIARERVGRDLDRALAEVATTSKYYNSLAVEASAENREDISNALFRAGEILAQGGNLEPYGDVYMGIHEDFEDLKGQFAERMGRIETKMLTQPETLKAGFEKHLSNTYAMVAHMMPVGPRSSTLLDAASDAGVYSEENINSELTGKMKEPQIRAEIETALRGTGISSTNVIARVEQGASNAWLEQRWMADDLSKIAATDGLNLERKADLQVAADKLDRVHVQLGQALERAEVLLDDGVIETDRADEFHFDENYIDKQVHEALQQMRREGASEAEVQAQAVALEDSIYDSIEYQQAEFLEAHPEVLKSPESVYLADGSGDKVIVDHDRATQIDAEINEIMTRTSARDGIAVAVAADFKQRYPEMPDHLAMGLGTTYATSFGIIEDQILADEAEWNANRDQIFADAELEDANMDTQLEYLQQSGIERAETEGIASFEATIGDERARVADELASKEATAYITNNASLMSAAEMGLDEDGLDRDYVVGDLARADDAELRLNSQFGAQAHSVEDFSDGLRAQYPDMPEKAIEWQAGQYADLKATIGDERARVARVEAEERAFAREQLPEVNRVIEHLKTETIQPPFDENRTSKDFRAEIENALNKEQLTALKNGDSDVLDGVIDERLDRLYAARAYLQSDKSTAHTDATRAVIKEIVQVEYNADRMRNVHGHTEKGTTHG